MKQIKVNGNMVDMAPLPKPSSTMKATGYDEASRTLVIQFKNEKLYTYSPIQQEAYKSLLEAQSSGSYLQQNIIKNKLVECKPFVTVEPKKV